MLPILVLILAASAAFVSTASCAFASFTFVLSSAFALANRLPVLEAAAVAR